MVDKEKDKDREKNKCKEKENILVVEDDASLSEWISDYLTEHGYQVTIANRGDVAVELIESDDPDLVVLDIMLPEKNGFDVCREVRQFFARPILMLTACSEEADEVLGLEFGADDYLSKPVRPRVLLARVKALLRRAEDDSNSKFSANSTSAPPQVCQFGELTLNKSSRSVSYMGQQIAFSSNEFDVLWLLASRAGEVISRTDLVSELRGIEYDGFDRSIDIRVSRIRKKLGDDPNNPRKVKTIRGKGYLFAEDAW